MMKVYLETSRYEIFQLHTDLHLCMQHHLGYSIGLQEFWHHPPVHHCHYPPEHRRYPLFYSPQIQQSDHPLQRPPMISRLILRHISRYLLTQVMSAHLRLDALDELVSWPMRELFIYYQFLLYVHHVDQLLVPQDYHYSQLLTLYHSLSQLAHLDMQFSERELVQHITWEIWV